MSTVEQMSEFIMLWDYVQNITLSETPDTITWHWTSHGEYTTKSAYNIQFAAVYCTFEAKHIWRAQAEGKHRFFVWQLVQDWTSGLWRVSVNSAPKEKRRALAAILIYTCWNLWNERNRRIFQGTCSTPLRVLSLIKEEVALQQNACGTPSW
ncbi:hypothetical protein SETIT_3G023000v2 [Setaria italica]|uniref:Reverse transcriptase zinc-binding domain-containing protein n=1 Tax=Setaria italica TaxID=4555 RepID=A0A368QAN3_SETIT|nr:hypothetical protein SETIT_3G023000v2 [Setaria italica]